MRGLAAHEAVAVDVTDHRRVGYLLPGHRRTLNRSGGSPAGWRPDGETESDEPTQRRKRAEIRDRGHRISGTTALMDEAGDP